MNVRPLTERLNLIKEAMKLAGQNGWILSGSIDDWGTSLEENFSLIVFLYTPTEVRISRLIAREIEKFGAEAIAPGGPRYENYQWFIEWASNYDSGTTEGRDLQLHETFLARQRCPVLRLSGTTPISRLVDDVVDVLQNRTT